MYLFVRGRKELAEKKNLLLEIETKRLVLRKINSTDAPFLYEYWSDKEVAKYMNIVPFERISQAEEMIEFLNSLAEQEQAFRWSIIRKSNHQILGTCGFNNWDKDNQSAEIGYELGKPHWRQGFMTEALIELISHGYKNMNLNRIQARVEPMNMASRKVLKKLGFQEDGLLSEYEQAKDKFIDLILYSILKSDIGNNI